MATNNRPLKAYARFDGTGRIVPGSLILRRNKPKVGNWKETQAYECCDSNTCEPVLPPINTKSFEFDIENLYTNLGTNLQSCHTYIRSKITGVNLFYDDDSGEATGIGDGGDDMYDDGNFINTNLTQLYDDIKYDNVDPALSIPYTHSQPVFSNADFLYANPPMNGNIIAGDSYFGTGSYYFTNMYPGLFILSALNLNGVTEFSITGDLGSDGDGTDYFFDIPTSYIGWTAYCKANKDTNSWSDPTVNHLILVEGNSSGITQVGDNAGAYDDHALQGISGITNIIYVVFSTLPGTSEVTKLQVRTLADAVLDVASGSSICN